MITQVYLLSRNLEMNKNEYGFVHELKEVSQAQKQYPSWHSLFKFIKQSVIWKNSLKL